jgi:hypothetical protein
MEIGKIVSLRGRMEDGSMVDGIWEVWNVERWNIGKLKKYSNHPKFYCSSKSRK